MKLMHVDASPKRERSNSRALSSYFVQLLAERIRDLDVDYLDVTVDTPAHPTELFAIATYTPPTERTPEMRAELTASDRLCARPLAADALLFAMPMHNFTMPSAFKAFIDNIVRGGVTYAPTSDGHYDGLLAERPTLFVTTRGADLRPGSPLAHMDALTPALRAAFGFVGVTEPVFVDAQPLQFADQEARAAALVRARAELAEVGQPTATESGYKRRVSIAQARRRNGSAPELVDEGAKRGRHVSAAGVVEVEPSGRRTPVGEHPDGLAGSDALLHIAQRRVGQPDAVGRGARRELRRVDRERPRYSDAQLAPSALELSIEQRA